jgi:hypothetical protein
MVAPLIHGGDNERESRAYRNHETFHALTERPGRSVIHSSRTHRWKLTHELSSRRQSQTGSLATAPGITARDLTLLSVSSAARYWWWRLAVGPPGPGGEPVQQNLGRGVVRELA